MGSVAVDGTKAVRTQYTKGVGEFDTSVLPNGSKPSEMYRSDEPHIARKPERRTSASVRMSRILPNTLVETLRDSTANGYHVTVNRFNGNNERLQVFIETPNYSDSIVQNVSMADLDKFIQDHTQ